MTVNQQANAARVASRELSSLPRIRKDEALHAMADALAAASAAVLAANSQDVAVARESGTAESLIDRLTLTQARIDDMVDGLRSLAGLTDPVGEVVRGWQLSNGVRVNQVRVPFGVVGIIYEARPNVTADAAGICLKSGNAVLLRGSSSALQSNRAVVEALRAGLAAVALPVEAITLIEGGRETTTEMMNAKGLIDVLIPRGGAGLINHVVGHSRVPVIETGTGNCHLYVDAAADLTMATEIMVNAKTQRPSVCNALETMLVHQDVAADFLPGAIFRAVGVPRHVDHFAAAVCAAVLDGLHVAAVGLQAALEFSDVHGCFLQCLIDGLRRIFVDDVALQVPVVIW